MTKLSGLILTLCFTSCGLFKTYPDLTQNGYKLGSDTTDIKPYEYVIIHKGYTPLHKRLNPENPLNIKISIKSFENVDTIPFQNLFQDLEIVLHDSTAKIVSGELQFRRTGGGRIIQLESVYNKGCPINFSGIKFGGQALRKNDILFFWDVIVIKNGIHYNIPSRKYFLK